MDAKFLVVVSLVIERDGKLLLMRRSVDKEHDPGMWEIPGGRLEQGEHPRDAARREGLEETELELEIGDPLDIFHFFRGPSRDETVGITFAARPAGGEVKMSSEHIDARWVDHGDVEAYGLRADLVHFLRRHHARSAR